MQMRAPGAAQEGLLLESTPDVASSRLPGIALGALLVKGPEASRLSTEPPETSEKHLPPWFPEAEALVSRDTAGEHPSG